MGGLDPFARATRDAARGLRQMPAELRKELGQAVFDDVASPLAAAVRNASRGSRPFGPLLEVKARKGTDPTIVVGGSRRLARNGATGRQLVYGVEFGGSRSRHQPAHRPYTRTYRNGKPHSVWRNTTAQFVPAKPFIYPTFRAEYAETAEAFLAMLDPFLEAWEAGT